MIAGLLRALSEGRADEARDILRDWSARAGAEEWPVIRAASILLNAARPSESPPPEGLDIAPLLGERARADTARILNALVAVAEAPHEEGPRCDLASLLVCADEPHWAEQVLLPLWDPNRSGPTLARVLSGVWDRLGRYEEALEAAKRAVDLAPDQAGHHIHYAGLLLQNKQPAHALLAAGRAIGLEPSNAIGWRLAAAALLELGEVEEALRCSRRAAALSDSQARFAEEIMVSAAAEGLQRLAAGSAPPPPPLARRHAAWAELPVVRPPRRSPSLLGFARTRLRVIDALMLREARTQFTHTRLGYAWSLFEPIMHVFILFVAIGLMGGSHAPIGDNLPLFYMTGVLPYLFFCHVTERGIGLARESRVVLSLPVVRLGDVIVARLLLRAATDALVFLVTLGAFLLMGIAHLPADPLALILAYGVLFLFSCGIALSNMVLSAWSEVPERVWTIVLRALYFVSGIFYHPSMMPTGIREWILWNPLAHALEWVREAYYPNYVSPYLDVSYLCRWMLGALLVGVILAAAARRQLRVPQ